MPNDFFQFQQFRIEQGACAMKVSTDACLLGSAVGLEAATRLLDVGTGTGLLALMAAQRNPLVSIEAIEIDQAAAAQAAANVAASPWPQRVRVHGLSLAEYAATSPAPFSHVVCNPPFFRQSWPSANAARNTARHASAGSLSFEELADFVVEFMLPTGAFTVLLPPPEMARFEQVASARTLYASERLTVRHRPGGRATRRICRFGRTPVTTAESELVIQSDTGPEYSEAFRALLAGFYLAL